MALFISFLLAGGGTIKAYDLEDENFYYNIISDSNKTAELADLKRVYYGVYRVPEKIEDYTVVKIARNVFKSNFSKYGSSVNLPKTIKEIEEDAFSGLIIGIYVDEENPYFSSSVEGHLCNKEMTKVIAGNRRSFTSFSSPITTIGKRAFVNGIINFTGNIPDNITEIEEEAFRNCSMGLYNGEMVGGSNSTPTTIGLPNNLRKISRYSFSSFSGLKSIKIPDSVVEIEEGAFASCGLLGTIELGNSVQIIGDAAFSGSASNFDGVIKLPMTLKSIGSKVFNSKVITSVTCLADVPPTILEDTFSEDQYNATLYVPSTSFDAYKNDPYWKKFISIQAATIPVTSITLEPTSITIKVGDTFTLTPTVSPANATNPSVTYSYSASGYLSNTGNVFTGLKKGTVTITAKAGDKTAKCTVTIEEVPVSSVIVSPDSKTIKVGETFTLNTTVLPENATNKTVTYTSYPTGIVSIEGNTVTGLNAGTTTITAKAEGKTATCQVTIRPSVATKVEINSPSKNIEVGDTYLMEATVEPEDLADKTLSWTSSNTEVASIDSKSGLLTAKKTGETTITAKCGDVFGIKVIEVIPKDIKGSLTIDDFTIIAGENKTVKINLNTLSQFDYKGFQFDVKMPEGLTLDGATINPSLSSDGFTIIPNLSSGRIFVYGNQLSSSITDGIVELQVTASANVTTSTKPIIIENVFFTTPGGSSIEGIEGSTCNVNITVPVTSITLSPSTKDIYVGGEVEVTATITPSTASNQGLTWSLSDGTVASVSGTGKTVTVTGLNKGTTTLTATAADGSGVAGTATINVVYTPITSLTITAAGNKTTILDSETVQLTATVDNNATQPVTFKYSSGNTDVATVSATGLVTGVKTGKAVITVTATNSAGSAQGTIEITVNPTPVTTVTLTAAEGKTTILDSETVQLTASVDSKATQPITFTYDSSNPSVATIDNNGLVTGNATGTSIITVKANNAANVEKTATITITVNPTPISTLILSATQTQIKDSENSQITATVNSTATTPVTFTYISENTSVATVNANGLVTGVAPGEAVIKVTAKNGANEMTKAITITVTATSATGITVTAEGNNNELYYTSDLQEFIDELQLSATITPANATPGITWSSSNERIATVDANGLVKTSGIGQVTITAKATYTQTVTAQYTITVIEHIWGDANDDRGVNVADVITIGNHIAELPNDNELNEKAADVIRDKMINVADQEATINIILGLPIDFSSKLPSFNSTTFNDMLSIDDVTTAVNGKAKLKVMLNNEIEYSSLQADILLPEGFEVENVKAGSRASSHNLIFNVTEEGILKVVIYSLSRTPFANTDESLFDIELKTNGNSGDVIMNNIYASNATCRSYLLGYKEGAVNDNSGIISTDGSGLNIVGVEGAIIIRNGEGMDIRVYDMTGKLVTFFTAETTIERINLVKGIYIVVAGSESFKTTVK